MSHQTVTANGVQFAYVEEGTGPLVLMVHGFPDTWHTWDAIRPEVAKAGYRVVTPNTRGYAPTSVPADGKYDADTLGMDILALIDALGAKKAVVIGHDWGAAAAYAAATLGPEKVSKLVTIAIPHPGAVKPTPALAWKARHFVTLRMPGAVARTAANDFAHIDELVQRWTPKRVVPPGENKDVKQSFAAPGSLNAALGYYRAVGSVPKGYRGKISVPTFSFAGLDDIIDPKLYEAARRRYTGGYEVFTMRGGHFMHREHPDEFLTRLLPALGPPQPT